MAIPEKGTFLIQETRSAFLVSSERDVLPMCVCVKWGPRMRGRLRRNLAISLLQ